jgi:hypothetical protein
VYTDTLQCAEIDQHIDQRVEVGDRGSITQSGTLDAQSRSLSIDSFRGRALFVERFVGLAVAVELVAKARAYAGRKSGLASTFGPVRIVDRAELAGQPPESSLERLSTLSG